MRRAVVAVIPGVCMTIAGGCAPDVLLEVPAEWPQEWLGRHLYHTPDAYIYASSEEAAGEADRVVIGVAREFTNQTGAEVGKGLIIVTDAGDEPYLGIRRMFELSKQQEHTDRGEPAMSEAELEEKWHELEAKMDESMGLKLDDLLPGQPRVLPPGQLADLLALPSAVGEASAWSVALPTRAMIAETNRRVIRATLGHKEIPLTTKALAAPFLLAAEPQMLEAGAGKRSVVLFKAVAGSQAAWSEADKKRIADDYEQRWTERIVGGFMKIARTHAASAPQQQAPQSAPATQTAPSD